jgi:hypothetical protein
MKRMDNGDDNDGITEGEAERRRQEEGAQRDERQRNRYLSRRHGVVQHLIAAAEGGDRRALRQITRNVNHSERLRADAVCKAFGIEDESK